MKSFKISCLLVAILATANNNLTSAAWHAQGNSAKDLKPIQWLSMAELQSMPPANELTLNKLEKLTVQQGAEWVNKMYHFSQAGKAIEPTFAPKANEIQCYYITPSGKKNTFKLQELPRIAREEQLFDNGEVTLYITGLPEETETVKKTHQKLVQAYIHRYYGQQKKHEDDFNEKRNANLSDEEREDVDANKPKGILVVMELGTLMGNINRLLALDVERTGMEIGKVMMQMMDAADVPREDVHIIGSNIGAHVAGATGRHFARETGHQIRRITGLDPSCIFSHTDKTLTGLARGDAEFVDVIHSSAYGLGTPSRHGDADFYPDGPSEGVPGANNIVEASLRAVLYFAETVKPGNERNFPAVAANSISQYKNIRGFGRRAYMGIDTDFDVKGDFMLQVNAKSPFGRGSIDKKQNSNQNVHQQWKMQYTM